MHTNMVHLINIKTFFLVIIFLFANHISGNSQEMKLHFFDLSKENSLDAIVSQLSEDGFEEKKEQNKSNIPSVCYTKSGEGEYIRFNCNYTPKTKQVASYWYRIYGGKSTSILNELKSLYGEPNSDLEYHAPNVFEWHSELVDIKLNIKDGRRELSSGELFAILFLIGFCLIGVLLAYIFYKQNKKIRFQKELYEIKRKEELNKIIKSNKSFIKGLMEKYGTPTRTISIKHNQGDDTMQFCDIIVFQQFNKIIIGRKEYNFCDIMNSSLHNEKSENAIIAQTTRTKTGSMLGRAALGALTFGVAGAVVGAVTAKKESTSTITPTNSGSYIVKIGLKSVEKPVLTLEFGSDKSKAEEVYALMQAIIAMK